MKSTIDGAKKPKRGRPSVETEAVNVRLPAETLVIIDQLRRDDADLPTRPEMVRRLVQDAIDLRKR